MAFQGFQRGAFQQNAFQQLIPANNDRAGDAAWPWEIAELLKKRGRKDLDEIRDRRWAQRRNAIERARKALMGIAEKAPEPEAKPVKKAVEKAAKTLKQAAVTLTAPLPAFDGKALREQMAAAKKAIAAAEAALAAHIEEKRRVAQLDAEAQALTAHALSVAQAKAAIAAEARQQEQLALAYAEEERLRIEAELAEQDDEEVLLLLAA